MADEIELHYVVSGVPETVMTQWREDPPPPLRDFEIADEAYDALVYESHYYDWIWKLMFVITFGFALLFKGFSRSVYRVTARFDAEGGTRTKITVVGKADPSTRERLGQIAAQNGGPVGLSVGV